MSNDTENDSNVISPIAALGYIPEEIRLPLLERAVSAPQAVQNILFSSTTGVYLQGTLKQLRIGTDVLPFVAVVVLRVCVGDLAQRDIAHVLSTEYEIPATQAQLLSQDIQKELLSPVTKELNNFASQQKRSQSASPDVPNVLDLKNKKP